MTRGLNINPNKTTFGGSCSAQLVTLELQGESLRLLALQFALVRVLPLRLRPETLPTAGPPTFACLFGPPLPSPCSGSRCCKQKGFL